MIIKALETYLHDHIPLSAAMQVAVIEVGEDRLVLGAPLESNINHRDTVFGGSASALAILSAWSLVHTRLKQQELSARLVIQSNTMRYDRPIAGDFTATAALADIGAWDRFIATFLRRGKARIAVVSTLDCDGQTVGAFEGAFVALAADQPSA